MKGIAQFTVVGAVCLLALASGAAAAVPHQMHYQGHLTDEEGQPLDTVISMTFTIYDDRIAGLPWWTETQDSVSVTAGLFTVLLGWVNPLSDTVFVDPFRWLGITVGDDPEISPRTELVTVPWAFRVATVDGASGGMINSGMEVLGNVDAGGFSIGGVPLGTSSDSYWSQIDSNIFYNLGNVGIGTTTPAEALDVQGNLHASGALMSGSSITIDGTTDQITSTSGTIDFDDENVVTLGTATIGPGNTNTGTYCFVAGSGNSASELYSTVGGGNENNASGNWSTISGGRLNIASVSATVGGGVSNEAEGWWGTVGGGANNLATGEYSTVGGGGYNQAVAPWAGVLSGWFNFSGRLDDDTAAFVGGGYNNVVAAKYATVGGGYQNRVNGSYSAILGGYADTIGASADYSYLFGIRSRLDEDSTFMVDMPHIFLQGEIWQANSDGDTICELSSFSTGGGFIGTYGLNGNLNTALTIVDIGDEDHGGVGVANEDGEWRAKMYSDPYYTGDRGVVETYGPNGNINIKLWNALVDEDAGCVSVADAAGEYRGHFLVTDDSAGLLTLRGPNDYLNVVLRNVEGDPNSGSMGVCDNDGWMRAEMFVDEYGQGIVAGDQKSFRVPNPNQPGTDIWYCSLEGPEAAAYVRGTGHLVNGRASVTLPDHFTAVASSKGITVQVTPLSGDSKGLAVVEKGTDRFAVRELNNGGGTYDFDFMVTAVRKGHEDYQVIRPSIESRPVDRGATKEESPVQLMKRPGR
jgi:hypothetical protein